jgi:hypothetical protein
LHFIEVLFSLPEQIQVAKNGSGCQTIQVAKNSSALSEQFRLPKSENLGVSENPAPEGQPNLAQRFSAG